MKPSSGWHDAILPNPFVISADRCMLSDEPRAVETSLGQLPNIKIYKAASRPSSQAVLPAHAPDFSGSLPQPIPTLGDYDEPINSSEINTINESSDLQRGAVDSRSHEPKLRGIGLIGAVFDVLSRQLGAEYTTAELMLAAQQLIDISKAEYVGVVHKDTGEKAGYYSWDLVRAFSSHPWQIAGVETQLMDHCDTDEFSPESFEAAKCLIEGRGERTWDF